MNYISKATYLSLLILLSQFAVGQKNANGTIKLVDSNCGVPKTETIISINNDSIWISQKNFGSNLAPGEKYETSAGTIRYYDKGDSSFYYGDLMVMTCDTCPEFWKYTLKSKDSLNVKPVVMNFGTDIPVHDGDTSYVSDEVYTIEDSTDLNRIRMWIFTITDTGDLLAMGNRLYRRQTKKE